jgi:TolB-like protein
VADAEAFGTLPFTAPEQIRGGSVDARTDIYALDVVLYEMATGRRPFQAVSALRLSDAILHQPPLSPRAVNSAVSAELERIILKCLEKDPESRYQSAKELAVDLRRLSAPVSLSTAPVPARVPSRRVLIAALAAVAVLAVVLALAFGGWRNRLLGRPAALRIESLAVLPLANLSRDPEQQYFADGMTEALITELAQIGSLKVISRTSVMQYKNAKKPLPEIAKELNVDAVVEGSVQRSGDKVGITVQLIHAPTDRHLWAKPYERDLRGVLALQREVARAIADEIRAKLTPQEQARLAAARPVNPRAH